MGQGQSGARALLAKSFDDPASAWVVPISPVDKRQGLTHSPALIVCAGTETHRNTRGPLRSSGTQVRCRPTSQKSSFREGWSGEMRTEALNACGLGWAGLGWTAVAEEGRNARRRCVRMALEVGWQRVAEGDT